MTIKPTIHTDSREVLATSGLKVGHWTNAESGTGCTVIVFDPPACCGVDVRGSSPGTREIALLDPIASMNRINAIVLTGGSAFGLAAASGVASGLHEAGQGFSTQHTNVPIVPAAVIYDLGIGDIVWPDESAGYKAYKAATDKGFATGNVGAGTGATAGSGASGTKSGLGSASVEVGALRVSAIVVANPIGSILRVNGEVLAGQLDNGSLMAPEAVLCNMGYRPFAENTVIGCVITNATLNKVSATKVAQMAHDGIARAVRPAHTTVDGDTLFCASLPGRGIDFDLNLVGDIAALAVSHAIRDGALSAVPAYGLPSALSLFR